MKIAKIVKASIFYRIIIDVKDKDKVIDDEIIRKKIIERIHHLVLNKHMDINIELIDDDTVHPYGSMQNDK